MRAVPSYLPLVSVAMITYNHERFVTKAIESVLTQETSFPFELVIGDDASSDHTREQIETHRAHSPGVVRTLIRPTNIGMHRNLESVLDACRGDFIAFLEGDDYWTSNRKLQKQMDFLITNPTAVGVFHPVTVVDTFGQEMGVILPRERVTEIETRDLLSENVMPTPSVLMRRDTLTTLPDNFRKLKMRDWPMWIFASLHGPWVCLPEVLAAYRVHENGSWSSLPHTVRLCNAIELFNCLATELPPPFAAISRRRVGQWRLEILEEALAVGQFGEARGELCEALQLVQYYYRPRDAKRFASALWQSLSPRTHGVAKRMLSLLR
jgi:glycosyltransferase involved in cell wall biosynthesis